MQVYDFPATNRRIEVYASSGQDCTGVHHVSLGLPGPTPATVRQETHDTKTGKTWTNFFCSGCNARVLARHDKLAKDAERKARKAARLASPQAVTASSETRQTA